MKAGRKGYLYSIVTVMFLSLLFFLIIFYSSRTERGMESTANKITTDELHYFITGVKNDLRRAAHISGKRAIQYSVAYILSSRENFSNYGMRNCTAFKYPINGTQAALSEMMLCGTLNGVAVSFMENNTLLDWIERINNTAEGADIVFDRLMVSDMDVAMYNAFHVGLIVYLDMELRDEKNTSFYRGYHHPINTVLININDTEDPLYFIYGMRDLINPSDVGAAADLMKYFHKCDVKKFNGTAIDELLDISLKEDYRCYFTSNVSLYGFSVPDYLNGPSFFDRCEGRLNLSPVYAEQSKELFNADFIGLESFVDLRDLWTHRITVLYRNNYSWVDYVYWRREVNSGSCCVNNTCIDPYNWTFRIDSPHILKYNMEGYDCTDLSNCYHPPC